MFFFSLPLPDGKVFLSTDIFLLKCYNKLNGNRIKKIVWIVVVAILIIAAAVYFFYPGKRQINHLPAAKTAIDDVQLPEGKIYLTLQSLYPENGPVAFYEFNPASKKLNKFPIKENNVLTPRFFRRRQKNGFCR